MECRTHAAPGKGSEGPQRGSIRASDGGHDCDRNPGTQSNVTCSSWILSQLKAKLRDWVESRLEPAATLGKPCPQLTRRPSNFNYQHINFHINYRVFE